MKNSEYWKKRFSQLEAAQNQIGKESYAEIEKQYRQAQKEIEDKINTWYQHLAKNNGVSMAEARKMLSASDLKEFKWDVEDYIKYGEENAVNGKWMKELENASAKLHISKYEALKMQTQQSLEAMFAKQAKTITETMQDVFKSGYFHTAYELQKGFGIGWDIAGINQSELEKILSKPWAVDGKNFSERILNNKEKLINEVHTHLTQSIITGADPQKAIDAILKKMNTSKTNAGRLVMTEEAYFSSLAQKECFNDLDVEKYEVVATLDSHTSDICQSLDGKVFDMKDYEPGTTAPPFHVNCRSTIIPYFDENSGDIGEREARDKDRQTYYLPDNMNYKEWKKAFVNGDTSGLQNADESDIINIENPTSAADIVEQAVGAKIAAPLSIIDAVAGANPNYNFGKAYRVNCQRCVQAYELRRRGYNVIAKPAVDSGDIILWGSECFIPPWQSPISAFSLDMTEASVKRILSDAPNGARYAVYVKWKYTQGAHVFIAEKDAGIVRYLDPQSGATNASDYFTYGSYGKFGLFRMDDKPITTDSNIIQATVEVIL